MLTEHSSLAEVPTGKVVDSIGNSNDSDTISIEEFVSRLDEWDIEKYIHTIGQGGKQFRMLGVRGADFVAYKCGISTIGEIVDEEMGPDGYITVVAYASYKGRTEFGVKRQAKKGSVAPLENAVSKARRNAICALIPHDVIVGKASPSAAPPTPGIDQRYIESAKAIEVAHKEAQAIAREVDADLVSMGISVKEVLEVAKEQFGDNDINWGVNDWKNFAGMLRNPADAGFEVTQPGESDDLDESDIPIEVDESDAGQEQLDI